MRKRALIGYTGFVGGALARQGRFDAVFNSRSIGEMAGRCFDEVVCAGVSAVKWRANSEPEADLAGVRALLDVLARVEARRFTLISTVDVYPNPVGVDEADPAPVEGAQPYGRHRRMVELFVQNRFPGALIVRLPGLFGQGLKKNLIFDVLTGGNLLGFDARSTFQFYDLDRLTDDIERATTAGLTLANLAVEPVTVAAVMDALGAGPWTNRTERPPVNYDMRTRHAVAWGVDGPYLEAAPACLGRIATFAAAWRAAEPRA